MFTGIVEEMGIIRAIEGRSGNQRTTLDAGVVMSDIRIGDSISLAGVCHTVVGFDSQGFWVESVSETLQRTTLGRLKVGSRVNLERSMRMGDRLGGHLVAGHVDCVGKVAGRKDSTGSSVFMIEMSQELAPYVAEKGSVAVDGISLTVVSVGDREFTVAIIPHTMEVTTISSLRPGDNVNLEADMVARYLERLVSVGHKAPDMTLADLQAMGY